MISLLTMTKIDIQRNGELSDLWINPIYISSFESFRKDDLEITLITMSNGNEHPVKATAVEIAEALGLKKKLVGTILDN